MTDPFFPPHSEHCPCCNSRRLAHLSAAASDRPAGTRISVFECLTCGFAWQYPVHHSVADSAHYFTQAYAQAATDESSYFNPKRRAAVAELQLALVNTLPAPERRLLDLGGGNGYFARLAAADGWQVVLVDPALRVQDFANSGVEAIRSTAADVRGRNFDVVTAWDVIEHVPRPIEFLHDAMHCLKDMGHLVLETGNYQSAERADVGDTHWIYQVDHRWYFTPESLGGLMAAAGIVSIQLHPHVLRPGWSGTLDYAGPSLMQSIKAVLRQPDHAYMRLRRHLRLRRASRHPAAGLPIFTLMGRKRATH